MEIKRNGARILIFIETSNSNSIRDNVYMDAIMKV